MRRGRDTGVGQTGYAHLFEHLAFSRTEHLERSVWNFLATIGARGCHATARYDYTHCFATVPVHALDMLLWLQAERMAHLVTALTEEDLMRSRAEVFQEEERLLQRWGQVHYAFRVQRDRLEEALARVRSRGVEVHGPVWLRWMEADAYYFYDPDGNLLEFWSPDRIPGSSSRT